MKSHVLAKGILAISTVLACMLPASAQAQERPAESAVETITSAELIAHIKYLASDELAGRNTPSEGLETAAKYVANEFKRYGLKPAGDKESYFQEFFMLDGYSLGPKNTLEARTSAEKKNFAMPKDFVPFNFSGSARIGDMEAGAGSKEQRAKSTEKNRAATESGTGVPPVRNHGQDAHATVRERSQGVKQGSGEVGGAIIFAGYGITDSERGYDDYAGIDAKGKIMLVLTHEPQERDASSDFAGTRPTKWSDPYEKALNARNHGAAGVFIVTDPNNHRDLKPRGSDWPQFQTEGEKLINQILDYANLLGEDIKEPAPPRPSLSIPVVHVSQGVARFVLAPMGKDLAKLQRKIDKDCKPCSFAVEGAQIAMEIDIQRVQGMPVKNVVAMLPGSDPVLAQEYVVVCAHYDHLGEIPAEVGQASRPSGMAEQVASGCKSKNWGAPSSPPFSKGGPGGIFLVCTACVRNPPLPPLYERGGHIAGFLSLLSPLFRLTPVASHVGATQTGSLRCDAQSDSHVAVASRPSGTSLRYCAPSNPARAGRYMTDRIFNGADDNASGTAGMLEIAQAFALSKQRPARSILFIAWAGEEKGFLGSLHFLKHPLVPLKSIKAIVNLDMIGRGNEGEVIATGPFLDKSLLKVAREGAEALGLKLAYIPLPRILAMLGGSDHSPFLMKGIPGIHLFAGMHEDYHQVSDEWDKIVPAKAEKIARLAYIITEHEAVLSEW